MKNFAEKIKSLVSGKNESPGQQGHAPFDFVKSKKGILKELVISKQSGNLLGVYSRALGEGMFLTGVKDIEQHGKEEVVVFNRYDMSGHILSRTRISIEEIQMVCPFNRTFKDPVASAGTMFIS
jgi:hypothetical protein